MHCAGTYDVHCAGTYDMHCAGTCTRTEPKCLNGASFSALSRPFDTTSGC